MEFIGLCRQSMILLKVIISSHSVDFGTVAFQLCKLRFYYMNTVRKVLFYFKMFHCMLFINTHPMG